MVECGADLVICQHSHCIGCYEEYLGSHILYGQGNLNFLWDNSEEGWYSSLLTELEITDKINIKFYPLVMLDSGVDVARGGRAAEIMSAFAERCEELKNGKWLEGFRRFALSEQLGYYKKALEGAFAEGATERDAQLFSHYLDCEAHTDVWRERFPTWQRTDREKK